MVGWILYTSQTKQQLYIVIDQQLKYVACGRRKRVGEVGEEKGGGVLGFNRNAAWSVYQNRFLAR